MYILNNVNSIEDDLFEKLKLLPKIKTNSKYTFEDEVLETFKIHI